MRLRAIEGVNFVIDYSVEALILGWCGILKVACCNKMIHVLMLLCDDESLLQKYTKVSIHLAFLLYFLYKLLGNTFRSPAQFWQGAKLWTPIITPHAFQYK